MIHWDWIGADSFCPKGDTHMEHKARSRWEPLIFLVLMLGFFGSIGFIMGFSNMVSTMMNTAFDLLINTCLYIMAIAVLTGALAGLFHEYGVIALADRLLSPVMKPLFGLPGAASVAVVTTFLSDNPAILSLTSNGAYREKFRKYQLPALTNLGTAFGMGLIVCTYMLGLRTGSEPRRNLAVAAGLLGALTGSVVSTRLMLLQTARIYGKEAPSDPLPDAASQTAKAEERKSGFSRFLDAALGGGKTGVDIGLAIIPGVLINATIIMLLTSGMPAGGYTGAAREGVAFLPWISEKLSFLLKPLFGFSTPEALAVPITSISSAGAAISIVPAMIAEGLAAENDIAVFTAMAMCWSGYLATHVAMMDSLGHSNLVGKSIISHTLGGIAAGVAANWLYKLLVLIFL